MLNRISTLVLARLTALAMAGCGGVLGAAPYLIVRTAQPYQAWESV
ncbi:hypothetical protein [Nonomuraea sp. NPDC048916]